jgi:hypothetical protein
LRAATGGDFRLSANACVAVVHCRGDQTWRYNISGKPFLGPVMGILFYVGLLVAIWLAIGAKPSFRKLGFSNKRPRRISAPRLAGLGRPRLVIRRGWHDPAIGVLRVPGAGVGGRWNVPALAERWTPTTDDRRPFGGRWSVVGGLIAGYSSVAHNRPTFWPLGNEPEVRVQYETMVTALGYLDQNGDGDGRLTITPALPHPAVALLTLHNPGGSPAGLRPPKLVLPGAAIAGHPGFLPQPSCSAIWLSYLLDELPCA